MSGHMSLSRGQLKEFLGNLVGLEENAYQLARLNQNLSDKLRWLNGQHNTYSAETPKPEKVGIFSTLFVMFLLVVVGTAIAIAIGLLVGGIIYIFTSGEGFIDNMIGGGCDEPVMPYLYKGGLWGGIIGAIICIVICIFSASGSKETDKRMEEEEKSRKGYLQTVNTAIVQVQNDLNVCQKKQAEVQKLIDQYFRTNILYHKYWDIIPICSFYEYIDSGRCSTLEGHEGAYNLYEQERRLDRILDKLDDIIWRLDDIRSNQTALYNVISSGNQKIDSLCGSVNAIENSAAMTQYYSAISAANSSYLAWLHHIR